VKRRALTRAQATGLCIVAAASRFRGPPGDPTAPARHAFVGLPPGTRRALVSLGCVERIAGGHTCLTPAGWLVVSAIRAMRRFD